MDVTLHPLTRATLNSLGQRRRSLLNIKLLCVLLIALLPTLALLALLDRFVLIPDALRWTLAVLFYLMASVASWWAAGRHLWGALDPEKNARLLQVLRPDLQDRTLSAVELGTPRRNAGLEGSPYFRERLQESVAERIKDVDPHSLLPSGRLRRWMVGLGLTAFALAALCFIPHLQFPAFLARAALPFVNLARPADVSISVTLPSEGDAYVPAGELIDFEVVLDGRLPDKVLLEARPKEGKALTLTLARTDASTYRGTLRAGEEDMRYRIRAGMALSPYYSLLVRPRPAVMSYEKTFEFPSYTRLEPATLAEGDGAVSALSGTKVTLAFHTNVPVASGQVELLSPDGNSAPVDLAVSGGLASASFHVSAQHDRYRVHLAAAGSGFTTVDPPAFPIESLTDQPPAVTLSTPEEETLERRSDALIDLAGIARDDIGLSSSTLATRINGGPWQRTQLSSTPQDATGPLPLSLPLSSQLSLAPLPLKVGDVVLARFEAADALGQRGESLPVRILITERPADAELADWVEAQGKLAQELRSLHSATSKANEAVERARESLQHERRDEAATNDPDEQIRRVERDRKLAEARDALADAQRIADRAWQALEQAAPQAPGRQERDEIKATGERLADIRQRELGRVEDALDRAAEQQQGRQDERLAKDAANRAAHLADEIAKDVSAFAAEDRAQLLEQKLDNLAEAQRQAAEKTQAAIAQAPERNTPPDSPEGGQAQLQADPSPSEQALQAAEEAQELALDQAANAAQQFDQIAEESSRAKDRAKETAQQLEQGSANVQRELDEGHHTAELAGAARQLNSTVEEADRRASELAIELAQEAAQRRENALRRNTPAREALAEARREASEVADKVEQSAQREGEQGEQARQEAAAQAAELADKLDRDKGMFQDLAKLEENLPAPNLQNAADLGRMARALDQVGDELAEAAKEGNAAAAAEASQDVATLEEAGKALEAAAQLEAAAEAFQELAREESRPSPEDGQGAASQAEEAAKDFAHAQAIAEQVPQKIRESNLDNAAAQIAEQARQPAQEAKQAAQERAQMAREQAASGEEAASLPAEPELADSAAQAADQLAQAMDAAADQIAEARQQVADLAPSVPEMMRAAAEQFAEAAGANEARADALQDQDGGESSPVDQVAQAMAEDAAAQQAVQEVVDALRQEAGAADLSDNQQAAQARANDIAMEALRQTAPSTAEALEQAMDAARDLQASAPEPGQPGQPEAGQSSPEAAMAQQQPQASADGEAGEAEATAGQRATASLSEAAMAQAEFAQDMAELANALEQLALAQPAAEQQLAAMEEALGAREALDAAYQDAQQLANALEALDSNQGEALRALEEQLAANPLMQEALAQIARETLAGAQQDLAQAGAEEGQLAEAVAGMAQGQQPADGQPADPGAAAQQQAEIAGDVQQAGENMSRAGRHAERLGMDAVGEALQQTGQAAAEIGEASLQPAAQQLAETGLETGAQAVQQAAQDLEQFLQDSGLAGAGQAADPAEGQQGQPSAAQGDPGQAPSSPAQSAMQALAEMAAGAPSPQGDSGAPLGSSPSPLEQARASLMAQALDQLDQGMAAQAGQGEGQPGEGQPGEGQPGQPGQPGQEAAAQSLAAAAAAQARAMAEARRQGMMPGQQGAPAEGGAPSPQESSLASEQPGEGEGEGNQAELATGQVPDLEILADDADWGRLPSRMAEDLVRGTSQPISPEYRAAIESYYRALATRAQGE